MTNGNLRTKESLLPLDPIGVAQTIKQKTMKLKFLILNFSFLILTACGVTKPVATTHTERIEEKVMPVAVVADTIEIVLNVGTRRAVSYRSPDRKSDTPNEQNQHNERANARQDTARCVPTIRSITSTRGVSMQTTHTDTTQTLRITLKPDTIFVPYVHHIRSDTIVIPDPTTKAKLTTARWQIVVLILILIAIIIFLYRKTR